MTPTMMLFFSLCAVLSVLMALVVIYPWMRPKKAIDNQLMAVNVKVFGERITELEDDLAAGTIDDAHYQAQSLELKRQLLDAQTHVESHQSVGMKSRLIIIIWIPVLVAIAYLTNKDRTPVFELWQAQAKVGQVADDLLTAKIDVPPEWATKEPLQLITAMQTNVHHNAHDPNRWMRLSELFMMLEAKPQALEALSRAHRLAPEDDAIAIAYAQTSFFNNNGQLDASARKVVREVLERDGNHEGAIMLMAMGETAAANYPMAKAWVAKLRSSIASRPGDNSSTLATLDHLSENITQKESAAAHGVDVKVTVDAALLSRLQASDTLFISISAESGGAPYAVKRLSAAEISSGELSVSLSDNDAMMPGHTLSSARAEGATLMVNARISHSGAAMPESGDLAANPAVLGKQSQVVLNISQVLP